MAGSLTKPQSRMRPVVRILLTAALLAALFAVLVQTLVLPARQQKTLQRLFLSHSSSPRATPSDFPALSEALSDYLSGRSQLAPQVVLQDGSTAFSSRELVHLMDVQKLFSLANQLLWISSSFLALMLVVMHWMHQGRWQPLLNTLSSCGFLAAAILIALLIAIVLWATIDFQSLFFAFHQVLFTNDLWLLDPNTDLLIQLMPLPFFIEYAKEALLMALGLMLLYGGVMTGLRTMARRANAR